MHDGYILRRLAWFLNLRLVAVPKSSFRGVKPHFAEWEMYADVQMF